MGKNPRGFQYTWGKKLFSINLRPELFTMIEDSIIENLGMFLDAWYEIFIGGPLRTKKKLKTNKGQKNIRGNSIPP